MPLSAKDKARIFGGAGGLRESSQSHEGGRPPATPTLRKVRVQGMMLLMLVARAPAAHPRQNGRLGASDSLAL
ncbi:unnamed protein product [Parascedosporium putredinis]|uniref:Uncharacterized protein n=1 Tax=Parascedosporium putredinis TaxID=1442378 RepID=A0A9P1HBA3_9PEZI|nr:unnamed protein product [Parascedosporium putredinis]CAI8003026.1 unnamed protein product [Parascedosporium putredinis]